MCVCVLGVVKNTETTCSQSRVPFYGGPHTGKTSLAHKFSRVILTLASSERQEAELSHLTDCWYSHRQRQPRSQRRARGKTQPGLVKGGQRKEEKTTGHHKACFMTFPRGLTKVFMPL